MNNELNKENVYREILKKKSNNPYIVENTIYTIENDMDIFPYPRWFQSVPTEEVAYIAEREAGWKPKNLDYIQKNPTKKPPLRNPNLCFQAPCSIVYPCYQQSNEYIGINRACTNQYR